VDRIAPNAGTVVDVAPNVVCNNCAQRFAKQTPALMVHARQLLVFSVAAKPNQDVSAVCAARLQFPRSQRQPEPKMGCRARSDEAEREICTRRPGKMH